MSTPQPWGNDKEVVEIMEEISTLMKEVINNRGGTAESEEIKTRIETARRLASKAAVLQELQSLLAEMEVAPEAETSKSSIEAADLSKPVQNWHEGIEAKEYCECNLGGTDPFCLDCWKPMPPQRGENWMKVGCLALLILPIITCGLMIRYGGGCKTCGGLGIVLEGGDSTYRTIEQLSGYRDRRLATKAGIRSGHHYQDCPACETD